MSQYEVTDESLVAGKSMDCLAVYSHLFRALMRVKTDKETRRELVKRIKKSLKPIKEFYGFLDVVTVDSGGIDILNIDVNITPYKDLRVALEEMLRMMSQVVQETVSKKVYQTMLFKHAMPYVKSDVERLQTYAILDDVIRHLF